MSDEALAAWAEGRATPEQVTTFSRHLASCSDCRELLSELSRAQPRPPPAQLGRYQLQAEVGRGGMGAVWSAWDPQLRRRVAVKIAHARRERGSERFMHERRVLAGLEHPHIARLLDAGETDDARPWFAMDFVDGEAIDQFCTRHGLGVRQRVELMLPVLSAVEHAHQHLVVHRDLKPSNILVDGTGQPHLVDFGIALMLERDARLTQTGEAPMTPAWASPEQVRGEPLTVRSDVYSLGVVLYELLARTSPYGELRNLDGLLAAVRDAEVPLMSVAARRAGHLALADELRGDLDAVVTMALRKDPAARYASAEALAEDLRAALAGHVTLARRGDRRYRTVRFLRRHRLAAGALSAVFLALAIGLGVAAGQARVARVERDRAARHFEQVRALAHAVLFEYHDRIADLPGATPVRERLVKDALQYLDTLSADGSTDDALRLELAEAYLKVGDVQGDPFGSSLGDTQGAAQSYARGHELIEAVVHRRPDDLAGLRAQALSQKKRGAISEVSGKLEEALEDYRRAAAGFSAVLKASPGDSEARAGLAGSLHNQFYIHYQQGDAVHALEAVKASLEHRRKLAAAVRDVETLTRLASALLTMSEYQAWQQALEDAVASAEEARGFTEEAVQLDPTSMLARRGKRHALVMLGGLLGTRGAFQRALEMQQQAVALAREDVERDPLNKVAARDLGGGLLELARQQTNLDANADALETLTEAHTIMDHLVKGDPTGLARRDRLTLLAREGVAAVGVKRWARAEHAYGELLADATQLLGEDPKSAFVATFLIDAHSGLGIVAAGQKDFARAVREADLCLAAVDALRALSPDNPDAERRRAIALGVKANIQDEAGQLAAACETARHALALFEQRQLSAAERSDVTTLRNICERAARKK